MSHDSAGIPFTGRQLSGTGFDDDTGAADPALLEALGQRADERALMAALAGARLIVPIVAAPTEVDDSGDLAVEKSTDMAVVTLTAPDGQRALPVFSSVEALAAWDASARPSPVTSALAAQAAVQERCDVMVLDLGSGSPTVLRPSMLWALAQQREWLPAHEDPFIAQALDRATAGEPDVLDVSAEAGEPGTGTLRVVLSLRAGLEQEQVQRVATRIGERIATDGEARARIDALAFAIRQA
ncbi:SseB family protein [Oryzihumus leptocrescens]|uniref:Type III secretion system (T3SS) SseB-like protein n=1 Tax=Oryzihumus leptocrescens TaxID=297536 RepID=A0A542ZKG0_9MICO|nr:SseB family protein [Oryzihumus leptocrescens]TQL60835.1 type III secretion system (T3SS) SseB-like protein [Oryzihumus leptocrescens]